MPVYENIVENAKKLGCEAWIENLNDYENRLNNENPSPNNWYLTDLRHVYNLISAHRQGTVTDDNYDEMMELEDEIRYWMEDITGWEEL